MPSEVIRDAAAGTAGTASRPAALQLTGLSSGYGGLAVVRDVSLHVEPGEVVALLGSNGAGKTTILSTVAGLVRPLAGTVRMNGEDVTGEAAHRLARAGCAMVPEDRSLFFGLTVREHLLLARSSGGVPQAALLEMLPELGKCLNRKAGLMSGGEQQMLAIGRALIGRPRLLLVDEMSLGLAPVVVHRLMPVLRRAADEYGMAVLFVEQHVPLALEVADRAYVVNHGRLVLEGPAATLRANMGLIVASYLGGTGAAAADPSPSSQTSAEEL